jgi:hypothetical protein
VIDKLPTFPRIKVPDAPWDFYTREESELVLSKARSAEERALLLFPHHTGARAGEQVAFEWGDYGRLDLANDPRDWRKERGLELADALVYGALAELTDVTRGP